MNEYSYPDDSFRPLDYCDTPYFNEPDIRFFSDIEVSTVDWLWYPYIPFGKVTIIQGDPGEGKTTLALNIAAILSRGEHLPTELDYKYTYDSITTIYQTAEDGLSDTIKPRLTAAKADTQLPFTPLRLNNLCQFRIKLTVAAFFLQTDTQHFLRTELPDADGQFV